MIWVAQTQEIQFISELLSNRTIPLMSFMMAASKACMIWQFDYLVLKSEEALLQIRLEYERWDIPVVLIPDFIELPISLEQTRTFVKRLHPKVWGTFYEHMLKTFLRRLLHMLMHWLWQLSINKGNAFLMRTWTVTHFGKIQFFFIYLNVH